MKKLLLTFLTLASVLFTGCPDDGYKMPRDPGYDFESAEQFCSAVNAWNNSRTVSYSYTLEFENHTYPLNYTVDVVVEGSHVTEYHVKKYKGVFESEKSAEEWAAWTSGFLGNLSEETEDSLLIENVYSYIEEIIEVDCNRRYQKNKDSCYVKITPVLTEEEPFVSSINIYSIIMQEEIAGNVSSCEFRFSDFSEAE